MKKLLTLCSLSAMLLIACNSNNSTKTEVTTLAKTTKSWNGDSLPKYLEGTPEITILKIVIPPKTALKRHKHPVINAGVLIKGELTVISETNDTLYLKTGEPIVELVNKWHYGKNESNEPAKIIVFYAGVEKTPITVIKNEK
jgi:quercetin dioxygenase-like cupin family protein